MINAGTQVFSGIRATGRLHLGNYLGAVKGMLKLQEDYDCIFSVVDLHTITTPYNPQNLQFLIREVVLDYLGAGLDPQKCHIMIQSSVPEHLELAYLLSTIYPVAKLEDLPTYKDKKAQFPKNVNLGLLYYPILMAADILIYKAKLIPVGIDQEPHLEVAREIARKFNQFFGETFPEPIRYATQEEYVPSLLGSGKMSKSIEGSYILLTDDLPKIIQRLKSVPTDLGSGKEIPKEGGVANLLTLVEIFMGKDARLGYEKNYLSSGISYSKLKTELAEAINQNLIPIQEKRKYYENHPEKVDEILKQGTIYSRQIAQKTLLEVKTKMGLI